MNSVVLTFEPDGKVHGLYTELINLQDIGPLEIRRNSYIEFNNHIQAWEVRDQSGHCLFSDRSRAVCLEWENHQQQ